MQWWAAAGDPPARPPGTGAPRPPHLPLACCAHPQTSEGAWLGGLRRETPVPHPCTDTSPPPLAPRPSPEKAGFRGSPTLGLLVWSGVLGLQRPLWLSHSSFRAQHCWLMGSSRPQLPSYEDETPSVPLAQAFHGQRETPQALGTGLSGSLPHRGERALRPRGQHTCPRPHGIWNWHAKPTASAQSSHRPQAVPMVLMPQEWAPASHVTVGIYGVQNRESVAPHLPSLAFFPKFPANGKYGCYSLGLQGRGNTDEGT